MYAAPAILLLIASAQEPVSAPSALPQVDFHRQIKPLLSDRCFQCHGPHEEAREAGLRLDSLAGATADLDGYQAIVPGDAEDSELVYRIHLDDDDRMPPPDSGLSLSAAEIDLLTRWIEEGADYPRHWAFEAPRAEPPPSLAPEAIDAFILARLNEAGLAPTPAATPEMWLRRASFAVTGLPPTAEEILEFHADLGVNGEDAYASQVDRLLASPHFGERFAQIWLDLARYADTYGYQADVTRRVWPYRDWVIDSYNRNQPFDEFLRDQLAGDLLPEATREQRVATAFNRLHRQTNEGGSIEEEYRIEYVADRVQTFGTAFLGLTFECARCHDHKFDPIAQRDFYRLGAFFDNIDESGLYSHFTSATPTPAMMLPDAAQEQELAAASNLVVRATEALQRARRSGAERHAAWLRSSAQELAQELAGDLAQELVLPAAQDAYDFNDDPADGFSNLMAEDRPATLENGPLAVAGHRGQAVELDGDGGVRFPGAGEFTRADPFSVALWLQLPRTMERAVVLHRSRAWTDAASQGWQLLIEDGRLTAALVHFWPGDAIAVRTTAEVPTANWVHLAMSYDGSSRADGLRLFLNGGPAETEVVRDHLLHAITGGGPGAPTLGQRFRDRGLAGGRVDDLMFFDHRLSAMEVRQIAASTAAPTAAEFSQDLEHYLLRVDEACARAREALRQARLRRDRARDAIPTLMVMEEMPQPRPSFLLHRGSYEEPTARVSPGTPGELLPFPDALPFDRLGLAQWLLLPDHPLTARVAVNRLWQAVFGRGLVATSENYGSQGQAPSHPQLLDYLAREFQASGWDRKALLRKLLLSATFRQSSAVPAAQRQADPENRLWSRGPALRLSAEMLRDAALAASGLLVDTIGGLSVKPYQPAGLWKEKSGHTYQADQGEGLYRRSLYTFWKRTSPPPSMMIFDGAKRDVCVARRESTSTPLQALVLWNDPQFVEAARVLAASSLSEWPELDDAERIQQVFVLLAARGADAAEMEALEQLLKQQRLAFAAAPQQASALLAVGDSAVAADLDSTECASWSVLVSALMSADPFLMLR